jgi:hypothetical protein
MTATNGSKKKGSWLDDWIPDFGGTSTKSSSGKKGGSGKGKKSGGIDIDQALGAVFGLGLIYFGVTWAIQTVTTWWNEHFLPWFEEWRFVFSAALVALVALTVLAIVLWARAGWRRRIARRAETRQPVTRGGEKPTVKVETDKATRKATKAIVTFPAGVHPGPREVEQLADIHGRDLFGGTAEVELHDNAKSGRTQVVLTPPRADTRDTLETALETVARQVLPQLAALRIDKRDSDGRPIRITIIHDPAFQALNDDVATEKIERSLTRKLGWEPHTYRMTWDPTTDVATLERWTDPLAKIIPPFPYKDADKVDLAALPLGVNENGTTAFMNLTGGRHTLLAGATGSGKSSIIQSAVRAGAPAVHAGWLQYRGIDPKGGAELGKARAMFYDLAAGPVLSKGPAAAFKAPEDAGLGLLQVEYQRQLELLVRNGYDLLMRAYRLGAAGTRKHEPSNVEPAVQLWIDEVALITTYMGSKAEREMAAMAIAAGVTQGRAWGFHLIAALQDPRMKTLEIRNLFPVKYALRLDRKVEVSMVLGDGQAELARADKINPETPGVHFVVEDGKTFATRQRAAYVADSDIDDMCKRFPAPEWEPPPPIGEMDFEEAVHAMVPSEALRHVTEVMDEVAETFEPNPTNRRTPVKKAVAKRPPTKKAAAARQASGDAPEVYGWDDIHADQLKRGDWTMIVMEDGTKRNVRVATIVEDNEADTVTIGGFGWGKRTMPATETVRRLNVDSDDE